MAVNTVKNMDLAEREALNDHLVARISHLKQVAKLESEQAAKIQQEKSEAEELAKFQKWQENSARRQRETG